MVYRDDPEVRASVTPMQSTPSSLPDVEERIAKCERDAEELEALGSSVKNRLLTLRADIENGAVSFDEDEFDDPSVVRRIDALRERVKRESKPPASVPYSHVRAQSK